MKRLIFIVLFANLVIYGTINFTLLKPIKYRHIKGKIIEADFPDWKTKLQKKDWEGYNLRGYFCVFRILYFNTESPDNVYKNIYKDIKKMHIIKT